MNVVAFFLVDITLHLSELNLKQQGQDNSVTDLMTAVRPFQRKQDIFKEDLEGACHRFPKLQKLIKINKFNIRRQFYVHLKNKLIENFSQILSNMFCFGQRLLLLIQYPFLIREVR